MLAARFSDNIEADIARNWSAWMLPGGRGSRKECIDDAMNPEYEGGLGLSREQSELVVREFPEFPGSYGCVHHEGLSAYLLDAENIEEAIIEVKSKAHDGSGYGIRTVGTIKLLITISAEKLGSQRALHIIEIEDYENEGF